MPLSLQMLQILELRVLPSYTFVPMSEVEQHVQQMVAARAQAVPEPDPVCNLPPAKRQATRWFLFLTRSVESPRRFLFLGRFLVWGQFLFLGQGFSEMPNC